MDSVVEWFIGLSIFFVALTLCAAICALSYRVLGASRAGSGASTDGQTALLAGSIALFGVLISGIFVFTTFRIDEGAQLAAGNAARERATTVATQVATELATKLVGGEVNRLENEITDRLGTAVEQLTRRSSLLSGVSTPGLENSTVIQVGSPVTVEFLREQSRTFEFSVTAAGRYVIDAIGVSPDFDAFLYLYSNGRIVEDNDDGGEGLNSRLDVELTEGVHRIRVEELTGFPGTCQISVAQVG